MSLKSVMIVIIKLYMSLVLRLEASGSISPEQEYVGINLHCPQLNDPDIYIGGGE